MRLFTAITMPEATLAELARVQAALRDRLTARRWQPLAQAHLTVSFLGEVPDARVPALEAMLGEAAAETPAFSLELGELGAFSSLARPHVLWVGVDGDRAALLALESRMRKGLAGLDLPVEGRSYKPHVTLAREVGSSPPLDKIAARTAIAPAPWRVAEVVLFKSELQPRGALHTVLGRYPLRSPG